MTKCLYMGFVRGLLQLSNEAIYFQPHPNFTSDPVKQAPRGQSAISEP